MNFFPFLTRKGTREPALYVMMLVGEHRHNKGVGRVGSLGELSTLSTPRLPEPRKVKSGPLWQDGVRCVAQACPAKHLAWLRTAHTASHWVVSVAGYKGAWNWPDPLAGVRRHVPKATLAQGETV